MLQKESFCVGRLACAGSGLRLYDLGELLDGAFASSDFEERTYDGTYHITQEAVGGDGKVGFVFVLPGPVGFAYVADRGLDIRMGATESGKVLTAEQQLGSTVHLLEVQSAGNAGAQIGGKGVFAGGDILAVGAGGGIKACVCVRAYAFYRIYGDAIG